MSRQLNNIISLLVAITVIYIAWFSIQWIHFLLTPMNVNKTNIEIEIKPGTTVVSLAWDLKRAGLLRDPRRFVELAALRGELPKVKAGEYSIEPGLKPLSFLKKIVNGKVILRQFTVIEGWNFNQMMNALNQNPYLQHTLNNLTPQEVMTKLGYPGIHPEGLFYPDTYLFSRGTPDVVILKKSFQLMQTVLAQSWNNRVANLPYKNSYDALIVASLIEKETGTVNEKAKIAGVIIRRLQTNMRLQIDPTVIYALGSAYKGDLTAADMVVDSPYNTYKHYGLPPTPIAMPSATSIEAALHPVITNLLYYVASGKGGHVFSMTLKAHDKAIEKYLLKPRFCAPPQFYIYWQFNLCPLPLGFGKI